MISTKLPLRRNGLACAALVLALAFPLTAAAADKVVPVPAENAALTYADLVDLADVAPLVLKAQIRKQTVVDPARAPGLAPGQVRLYVEARTTALIAGNTPVGESLHYLVDVPLGPKGKVPKLKKKDVILFARPVPGKTGEIQLVGKGGQLLYDPETEARLRPILAALLAPDAPPRVTRVRDALSVPGNLAGESETQIFLDTDNHEPVSITVTRRPDMAPVWGVSWTEIVDQAARPPQPDSLAWYRLACALPPQLPGRANLARDAQGQVQAARDYALVVGRLGPCNRSRAR